MHAFMHACRLYVYIYIYICTCLCLYARVCVCMCAQVYARVRGCVVHMLCFVHPEFVQRLQRLPLVVWGSCFREWGAPKPSREVLTMLPRAEERCSSIQHAGGHEDLGHRVRGLAEGRTLSFVMFLAARVPHWRAEVVGGFFIWQWQNKRVPCCGDIVVSALSRVLGFLCFSAEVNRGSSYSTFIRLVEI